MDPHHKEAQMENIESIEKRGGKRRVALAWWCCSLEHLLKTNTGPSPCFSCYTKPAP